MVQRDLPASVYRCKVIVFTDDAPGRPLALQIVGRRTELAELDRGREAGKASEIAAIGQGIDPDALNELFAPCLATA